MPDDQAVAPETAHYPSVKITPSEFEQFVVELLNSVDPLLASLEVTLHDRIEGVDGLYDFDATVRFGFAGMRFLVLVEAKRHKNPIKRELVQVLHSKLRSVGAQKAAMIATAPYQRGALDYAKAHGIALATVTEGRFTFETKSFGEGPTMTRQQGADQLGLPEFVGHAYGRGPEPQLDVHDASQHRVSKLRCGSALRHIRGRLGRLAAATFAPLASEPICLAGFSARVAIRASS